MLPVGELAIELLEPTEAGFGDREISREARRRTASRRHESARSERRSGAACGVGRAPVERAARRRRRASLRFRAPASTGGVLLELIQDMKPTIGIIGGSGLYSMPGFEAQEERAIDTPWGAPSDAYVVGQARGQGGRVSGAARPRPSHLALGAEFSRQHLRHEIAGRGAHSFAQRGRVAQGRAQAARFRDSRSVRRSHARPRLDFFRRRLGRAHQLRASDLPAAGAGGARARRRKRASPPSWAERTCAWKGPAFSTLAESNLYRSWGMDVIGMTNLQEAKLAREAEICYVTIAMVTDYDCWHPDHDAVTVNDIIAQPDARTRRTPRSWSRPRCAPCRRRANANAARRWRMP